MIRLLKKSLHFGFCSHSGNNIHKPLVDYSQRGQYRGPLNIKVGDVIHDFEVKQSYKLPDFEIDCVVLQCKKFQTEWVHFACEQEKNSLALVTKCSNVPTFIKMSLEQMLQCGSHKFPVRSPIQHMTRRSFNPTNQTTTTSDYMFYAYQTTLLKDHRNLMEVFLHTLYNPLMRPQDFKDIVWRYELKGDRELVLAGDVLKDIRGMQAMSELQIFDVINRDLLGRTGHCFEDITKLKYDDLMEWYRKVFDPRKLLIISHGDLHPTKIIQNYREITSTLEPFKSPSTPVPPPSQKSDSTAESTKTIKISHLDTNTPLLLSFKIDGISPEQRILLGMLSMILFDMPDSVMMQWNTPSTPYPKHYGFQGQYFNIGITLDQRDSTYQDREFIEKEKFIRDSLTELCDKKISDFQIEKCLLYLEGEYYTRDGLKLILGCLDNIVELGTQSLEGSLNVKAFVSRILRTYRRNNIFEELLKKHILNNQNFIRVYGKSDRYIVQNLELQETIKLRQQFQKMPKQEMEEIRSFKPASILQDYRILPKISINQYQIFEQKNAQTFKTSGVPTYHTPKCDGVKISLKYDITDLQEDDLKLLPVLCCSYPWMGAKAITSEAYNTYVDMYIRNMDMKVETVRTSSGMKLYLFLNAEFSDRNAEFCFNLLTSLINDHNHDNFEVLSQAIQKQASEAFNYLSENMVQIHGRHLGASCSPYALLDDPLFATRTICSLASDVQKITDAKQILRQVANQMKRISEKMHERNRIQLLMECKTSLLQKYHKYMENMLKKTVESKSKLQIINDVDFTPTSWLKYFPNYQEQFAFEAFPVPYYHNLQQAPATLVLSSLINQNIRRLNPDGGSFLFKGSLISYIRGNRKKILELEQYYKKIEDIEEAKRSIFQQFHRYTSADIFYTGISAEEARIFKQSVAMVNEANISACLEKYMLSLIKEGKSSILCIGPHLGSYEPIIKKGWTVQRSVQDMSLQMESMSAAIPQIETSKYINIY